MLNSTRDYCFVNTRKRKKLVTEMGTCPQTIKNLQCVLSYRAADVDTHVMFRVIPKVIVV